MPSADEIRSTAADDNEYDIKRTQRLVMTIQSNKNKSNIHFFLNKKKQNSFLPFET